jgi:hypothetical protein
MKTNNLEKEIQNNCPCFVCIVRPLCIIKVDLFVAIQKNVCKNYLDWREKMLDSLIAPSELWRAESRVLFPDRGEKSAAPKMQ